MEVRLAYGEGGLPVRFADSCNVRVIEPIYIPRLPDEQRAVTDALRHPVGLPPLKDLVPSKGRVGIIVNDITRATPTPLLLRCIIDELNQADPSQIIIFIALGSHRPATMDELDSLLGPGIRDTYAIVQNDAFDRSTQVEIGESAPGRRLWINRQLIECDLKILTGFIEPHFFAGYSGGGKAIMSGMAGLETILNNHSADYVAHPSATWDVTRRNPIWEETRTAARAAGSIFLLNITLNRDKQITGVFAGDLDLAYSAGVAHVRRTAIVEVSDPFDIVVTTNSGFPLDRNLYQAVKGMSAAARVVKPGGAIVIAAECRDGVPDGSMYSQILHEAGSPAAILAQLPNWKPPKLEQWQAQVQAQILMKADVFLYSEYLSPEQVREALLVPIRSVEETLQELVTRIGAAATICVLPEGPQTIPVLCQHSE